jgi:hypothetical protein
MRVPIVWLKEESAGRRAATYLCKLNNRGGWTTRSGSPDSGLGTEINKPRRNTLLCYKTQN